MVVHSSCLPNDAMPIRKFLVNYRVVISFFLFSTLVVSQLYVGMKPRGWWGGGDIQGLLGVSLVIIGLLIRSWAAGVLRKGKALAIVGPYSLCKHPLYVGSFCMMIGFCLVLGNPLLWFAVVGPVAVIYWFTMLSEERKLNERFADQWRTSTKHIPRFLPWRWAQYKHTTFSLQCWFSNREYKALLTTIVGLIALEMWRLH